MWRDEENRSTYKIEGDFKNARASDTRCFSPPLSWKKRKVTVSITLSEVL